MRRSSRNGTKRRDRTADVCDVDARVRCDDETGFSNVLRRLHRAPRRHDRHTHAHTHTQLHMHTCTRTHWCTSTTHIFTRAEFLSDDALWERFGMRVCVCGCVAAAGGGGAVWVGVLVQYPRMDSSVHDPRSWLIAVWCGGQFLGWCRVCVAQDQNVCRVRVCVCVGSWGTT